MRSTSMVIASTLVVAMTMTGCGDVERSVGRSSASAGTSPASASKTPGTASFQAVPGTRIALPARDGLQVDPSLPGLVRPDSETSVVVLDEGRAPAQHAEDVLAQFESGFRDGGRAARTGLRLGEPQRRRVAGFPATVVTGTQTQGGAAYGKVLVAIASDPIDVGVGSGR